MERTRKTELGFMVLLYISVVLVSGLDLTRGMEEIGDEDR